MSSEEVNYVYSDEEESDEENSSHYVTAPPSGVLSIHCKKVKHLNENHIVEADPELYLRIRVGSLAKCTKNFHWTAGSKFVVVHEIKHFSLMVSRVRSDPSNDIRIDLVMVETAHVHRIIGHKDIHLYDLIRNLYLAGTYELKFRQNAIALLDCEICFAYGIFGYGYSHQLQNRQKKVEDIVGHSYLYRSEPPLNRKQSDSMTMAPVPMEHPDFISFAQHVQIGSPAVRESLADRFSKYDMDVFADLEKHEPVILARTMRRRLHKIQNDFRTMTNRKQRKKFLEKLVLHHLDDSHKETEQKDDKAQPAPDTIPDMDQVAAPRQQAYGDDDDHACVTDVPELTAFLASAPGIQVRGRADRNRPSMSVLLEDEAMEECDDKPSTSATELASSSFDHTQAREDRQRSTLAELPGNLMMSFANKLRLWKSKKESSKPSNPANN